MKDQALAIAKRYSDPVQRLNALREYLQTYIMRSLHESEASKAIAFVGGTALRFIENLPRFSEDLDYSLISSDKYEPLRWFEKLKRDLSLAGFVNTISWNDRKTVQTAWIRIASILKDAGLSGHKDQKLSIKIEIDTHPPDGATVQRTIITRHLTFVVSHYDLPSLMAGKIHALLTRSYPKGRDWFDLVWYGSHRPPVKPNAALLQNALNQTQRKGIIKGSEWPQYLQLKLEKLNTDRLIGDVQAFLERPEDCALLERENLNSILSSYY